jgi:hypothetical protein
MLVEVENLARVSVLRGRAEGPSHDRISIISGVFQGASPRLEQRWFRVKRSLAWRCHLSKAASPKHLGL